MPYTAFLVDDDVNAIASMEIIINDFCPALKIEGQFTNPLEAIKNIHKQKPDLIFLDIDMPEMSGFELLELIPDRLFEVIFVTAHNDRAIDAFRANAIDYILKPVNITELISAVNKAVKNIQLKNPSVDRYQEIINFFKSRENKKLAVKNFDGVEFIDHDEVLYIDADGAYSTIFTKNRNITISKNLKELGSDIDSRHFFRVHNSHIVNINHIKRISLKDLEIEMTNSKKLPISKRCREEFIQALKENNFL